MNKSNIFIGVFVLGVLLYLFWDNVKELIPTGSTPADAASGVVATPAILDTSEVPITTDVEQASALLDLPALSRYKVTPNTSIVGGNLITDYCPTDANDPDKCLFDGSTPENCAMECEKNKLCHSFVWKDMYEDYNCDKEESDMCKKIKAGQVGYMQCWLDDKMDPSERPMSGSNLYTRKGLKLNFDLM